MVKVKWSMSTAANIRAIGLKTRRLAKAYTCLLMETDMNVYNERVAKC